MILLDTSAFLAALDRAEPMHERSVAALSREAGPFVLSPFVLAELDYLLTRELGTALELALLDEVAAGVYELASFGGDDVAAARDVIERYRDLGIGLADASLVVLSGKLGCERVLTLDERHFRALRAPNGRPFTLLPADA